MKRLLSFVLTLFLIGTQLVNQQAWAFAAEEEETVCLPDSSKSFASSHLFQEQCAAHFSPSSSAPAAYFIRLLKEEETCQAPILTTVAADTVADLKDTVINASDILSGLLWSTYDFAKNQYSALANLWNGSTQIATNINQITTEDVVEIGGYVYARSLGSLLDPSREPVHESAYYQNPLWHTLAGFPMVREGLTKFFWNPLTWAARSSLTMGISLFDTLRSFSRFTLNAYRTFKYSIVNSLDYLIGADKDSVAFAVDLFTLTAFSIGGYYLAPALPGVVLTAKGKLVSLLTAAGPLGRYLASLDIGTFLPFNPITLWRAYSAYTAGQSISNWDKLNILNAVITGITTTKSLLFKWLNRSQKSYMEIIEEGLATSFGQGVIQAAFGPHSKWFLKLVGIPAALVNTVNNVFNLVEQLSPKLESFLTFQRSLISNGLTCIGTAVSFHLFHGNTLKGALAYSGTCTAMLVGIEAGWINFEDKD